MLKKRENEEEDKVEQNKNDVIVLSTNSDHVMRFRSINRTR